MPWFTAYRERAFTVADEKSGIDTKGATPNDTTTGAPIQNSDTNNDADDEVCSKAETNRLAPEHTMIVSFVLADLSSVKASSGIQTCWLCRIDVSDPFVAESAQDVSDLVFCELDNLRAYLFGEVDRRDGGNSSSGSAMC